MNDTLTNYNNHQCWLSVYLNKEEPKQYHIAFDMTLQEMLAREQETILLFYRQFMNIADGIAHKLLLEQLSPDSIEQMIIRYNNTYDNLYNDFIIPTNGNESI